MENNYFIRNRETGKLELHFDKATYQGLGRELKEKIKSYFLFSRNAGAWVSKGKFDGYFPQAIAKEIGLTDAGETGERLSFAEQQEAKVERAENRAERMETRAKKAISKAEGLQAEHNRNCQDHAYVFQPGMGGAFDRYRERVANRYGKGFEEYRKSEHYTRQAETARRTASQAKLQNPAFLDRRIKENEAEIREINRIVERINAAGYLENHVKSGYPADSLEKYEVKLGERFEEVSDKLNYYRTCLDEIGGAAFSKGNVSKGDLVKIRGNFCLVQRANPSTVNILIINGGAQGMELKYPYAEIKKHVPQAAAKGLTVKELYDYQP